MTRSVRSRPGASLLPSMSGALVLQTAGAALNLAVQLLLAKVLGAQRFGQYSVAFNTAQLLGTPVDLGGSSSVVRFLPEYRVNDRPAELRGLILVAQLVPLVLGSLVAGAAAAVVAWVGVGSAPVALALVALSSIPLFALSIVLMNVLRSLGSITAAFAPILVLQPALLLGAVLALPDAGLLAYGWATVAALAVVVLVQLVALRRRMRQVEEAPRRFELAHWFSVSLPMLVINLVQLAFQRMDIIMVGLLLGARAAGVYTIANRLAVAAASLQKAMLTVVAPKMSSLHWSGQTEEVEQLVLRGLRLVFPPAAVVTLVLVVGGQPMLGAISDPYRAGYAALVVYALGQLASVAAGPVGWLAAIIGEERAMARLTVASALVALVGYAVLIPTLGIVGAAAANSLGIVFRNVAAARLTRRHGFHISVVRAFARAH